MLQSFESMALFTGQVGSLMDHEVAECFLLEEEDGVCIQGREYLVGSVIDTVDEMLMDERFITMLPPDQYGNYKWGIYCNTETSTFLIINAEAGTLHQPC